MFSHPSLYTPWAVQPLSVASSPDRFAKCEMSASLLSNDQVRLANLLATPLVIDNITCSSTHDSHFRNRTLPETTTITVAVMQGLIHQIYLLLAYRDVMKYQLADEQPDCWPCRQMQCHSQITTA